ncbi:lysostaphin resistance A-like protein [Zafaria sp. Z1313]|uniref:CPBP family intramembrane glutamic endopeptidase n=1 Tax=Zafaria sp. Z1313 TaxID=3423202 RepID=UPI003D30269C
MRSHPQPGPAGPYPFPGSRRRQPVFDPGRFGVGDGVTVGLYILLFVVGLASFMVLVPGFTDTFSTPDTATFAVNLIVYAVLFTAAMIVAFGAFRESLRTFAFHPWAKGFGIPGAWFGSLMITAAILMGMGEVVKSENQLAIEGMTYSVPFPTMFVVAVVMGPFVEEYVFRHLLIGKLSRYVNVWLCVVVSIALFAGIHFIGTGSFDVSSLVPYLTLGTVISVAYVLTGKSLAYAYILHFFNNAVALSLAYTVLPLLNP